MIKTVLTSEERLFLNTFKQKPRHTFCELVRYAKIMEKLTK